MKSYLNRLDQLSRRQFMENTAKTALGVSVLPAAQQIMAQSSGGKAKNVIYMYMSGGMTHLDTFDPKPGADTQGRTGAANTKVAGEKLGEYMPGLAERFNDLAVIRTMTQKTGDHRGASYWMRTSYQRRATIVHPSLGAWGQKLLGKSHPTLPDSVIIGGGGDHPGAGFLGPSFAPLPLGDPNNGLPNSVPMVDEDTFEDRMDLVKTFNNMFTRKYQTDDVQAYTEFYDNTLQLMNSEDLEVFDLSKESQDSREKYGMNRFGQGLLLAKRMVSNGIRFVEITKGGWDMHNDLWNAIPNNAGELDMAISALIDDLKAEGLFDSTMIVLTTEFGRTPRINVNAGRDHHPLCFSAMVAGGGIVGGQTYGKSDAKGYAVEENPVEPKDLNATIAHAAGMPLEKVIFSPSGRPFLIAGHKEDPKTKKILSEGAPIMQLFS